MKRYIPVAVRRQLRREAHFGCAICGSPILDYHHIIPWSEKQHHDPEHMVALCPTHHRSVGSMKRAQQYRIKAEPINAATGVVRGYLTTDKDQPSFVLGSNTFVRTPVVFSYYKQPIFSYTIREGQSLISAYIPRSDFWPEIKIIENDFFVEIGDLWDIVFQNNFLRLQRKRADSFFEINLKGPDASVSASFTIEKKRFEFSPTGTTVGGGAQVRNCTFSNSAAGIGYGDGRHRLLLPNYAMAHPGKKYVLDR